MFYLKYRPQKVCDLDLESVRQKLGEVLQAKTLPHAFLFAGPKGTGKTSAARILAKAVNCLKKVKSRIEPCNKCSICKGITNGTALDLIEIDAASNRGIDDIRNLRERVKLAPTEAKYKVYVIDEAHMLTREAFNALLKTLEEPPGHVIFILATTEPEKLPETIVSRCLYFQFRKGKSVELRRSLGRVIRGEKIKITAQALEAMVKAADGSFRDAQKILEQLAMKKRKITAAMVNEEVAGGEGGEVRDFLKLVINRETKEAVEAINEKADSGLNLESFTMRVLEELRVILLNSVGLKLEDTEVLELPLSLPRDEVIRLITLFEKALLGLKGAVIPQLPLEMAVVSWSCTKHSQDEAFEENGALVKKKEASLKNLRTGNKDSGVDREELERNWETVLKTIKSYNHSVGALLRSARPLQVDGKILTIEVFYPFHQERLNTQKNREMVEKVVRGVMKRDIGLKFVLGNKKSV